MTTSTWLPLVQSENRLFKPLYYLGCKANFVSPILEAINDVSKTGPACDLFAGSGSIAAAMAADRNVTAVDIQEYSRVFCSAQLTPAKLESSESIGFVARARQSEILRRLSWCFAPLIDFESSAITNAAAGDSRAIACLLEAWPLAVSKDNASSKLLSAARVEVRKNLKREGLASSRETTVSTYFGGVYFSYKQSIFLDCALELASRAPKRERDTLVAAILSSASSVVNTVGKQFAQPLRPREKSGELKRDLGAAVQRDRLSDASVELDQWLSAYAALPLTAQEHRSLRMDYLDALRQFGSEFAVVYADPPYTRDHYSRFYHVLETMCLRDAPKISLVKKKGVEVPSRGLYREGRHQSPFCVRSEAPDALDKLFKAARENGLPVVLSYSPHEAGDGTHPRVMLARDIIAIAERHYRRVKVDLLDGSTHNKLNRSGLSLTKRLHAEMIVKCSSPRAAKPPLRIR